jgi:hypothetical protein
VNLAADVGGDGRRAVQLITGVHQRAHPATEVGIIGSGDEPVMRQVGLVGQRQRDQRFSCRRWIDGRRAAGYRGR